MSRFLRLTMYVMLCTLVMAPSSLFARTSNDPHMMQWAYRDIGVYRAWDDVTGSRDVVVAIIDNGFDTFHPDLVENVWINRDEIEHNGIDDDNNGYIDDVWGWNFAIEDRNGDGEISPEEQQGNNNPRPSVSSVSELEKKPIHHGTLVAGIIGAAGNNGKLGSGINWRVKLMNIKVLGNKGNGELNRLGDAIRYAVDNGADIINFSVVGTAFTKDMEDAVLYAYDRGVAMVAAAGNNLQFLNENPFYPVCADRAIGESVNRVLGVSAMDEPHTIALFSNTGSDCIDITAPGVNISSTMRYAPNAGFDEQYGGGWNGTSFAAPMVSGAIALIKGIHPTWRPAQLYNAVLSTVHKTPPKNEQEYANLFGNGLLQIDDAVAFALEQKVAQPFMSALGWVDPALGDVHEYDNETSAEDVQRRDVLRNIEAISAFHTGAQEGYVAVKRLDVQTVQVDVLSSDWVLQSSWHAPLRGEVSLTTGDILGNDGIEIVLASDLENTMTIYSRDGISQLRIPLNKNSSHIGLATVLGKEGKEDILATYRFNEAMTLHRYTGQGRLINLIPLRNVTHRAIIQTGDITGDGTQEVVVVGGEGEEPIIMHLKQDGTLVRAVFGYEPGMRRGLRLLVRDYDVDGVDDIIVVPKDGSDRMRVWQDTSIIAQPQIAKGLSGFLIPVL